nr:zinc-dependent metalloprotease [Mycolicibacterium sp.]
MASSPDLTVGRAVDWRFAGTVGAKLVRPGPPTSDYTRQQAIDDLAEAALAAEIPVREVTGLSSGGPAPAARIVDREQWIRAASDSMRVMTGGTDTPSNAITGRVTGAQTGAVLAFISSGILGQYDPFAVAADADRQGVLLLVYPNVLSVERQLRLSPKDFRLWVCLHEVTHRVQFTANPWLSQHMSDALAVLTAERHDDVGEIIGRLAEFVRERRRGTVDITNSGVLGLMRAVQSESQREALDKLLVLGTLLEGHADYVMDAVGPAVVPSVNVIRRRFDDRRERKQPPLQRLLRALLGVDAKLSQYTRGRAFVDGVVDRVGMTRFNAVWSGPDTLPLPDEIENPQRWIDRVL